MDKLKIIIEFSDCILRAQDLESYTIMVDEDLSRVKETQRALSRVVA